MKQWLIPAIVLLTVGGVGLGVGWSINEWQNSDEAAPVQTGPTQAEVDVRLCEAALQALGQFASASEGAAGKVYQDDLPPSIKEAIDRYCH